MEKLRVGIVGLKRGATHVRNFSLLEDVQLVGGCDWHEQYRKRAAEKIEPAGGKVFSEFDELLELQPDAVVLACNGRQQAATAIKALEAGCHVLSEVPGAFYEEELIHLRDAVERTGMTYMLGENSCFLNYFRYWRKWVVEDRMGPISLAEGEYLHYLPAMLCTSDNTCYTPSQAKELGLTDLRPSWRADQPPIQYLTHDLGPLLEVLDDRVVSVSCRSGPWQGKETSLRSDGQYALFETAKGTLIRILVTLNTRRPAEHRYRLFGTEGACEYFSYEGYCRFFGREHEEADGWQKVNIGPAEKGSDTSAGHGGTDMQTARHFTKAVLNGDPAPIDVYRAIEFCLPGIIANRSAELGGAPLPIPQMRREPYSGTRFWDVVGLPDAEPHSEPHPTALE